MKRNVGFNSSKFTTVGVASVGRKERMIMRFYFGIIQATKAVSLVASVYMIKEVVN